MKNKNAGKYFSFFDEKKFLSTFSRLRFVFCLFSLWIDENFGLLLFDRTVLDIKIIIELILNLSSFLFSSSLDQIQLKPDPTAIVSTILSGINYDD